MKLKRHSQEPILSPIKEHTWESVSVFNCSVVYDGELFHMLYRAADSADKKKFISSFGYAVSKDGFNFMRLDKPVFQGEGEQEKRGCEDPRITKFHDKYYIIYSGYSGYDVRICMATTKNFITYERQGVFFDDKDNKDAALFPDKVKGKYVLLHRRMPNIWLSFSDDLIKWEDHILLMEIIPDSWQSYKIGINGPPLKTESGWLLFYHGVDNEKNYRLGAALLDLNNPAKVLKRYEHPILEPELQWEKQGVVSNVVFSCCAIEYNNQYFIYYGGADTSIGLATVSKEEVYQFFKISLKK